jgi:hypothetical protein
VSENRVFRRIFGPKREEVAEGWRRLHNEELHELYATPHISKRVQIKEDEMDGTCSTHGIDDKFIKYFGWKTQRQETTRKT